MTSSLALLAPVAQAAQPVPEVDLAITKVDSKDPVEPEEQFQYFIEVTNNGPSGAPAVVVTDTLPPEVSFVDASAECSHSAGIVTCNLGAMAPTPMAGSVRSLFIGVQVNPGIDDTTFLNVVVVKDDTVTETDLTNNQDDEPTTVNPLPLGSIGDLLWSDGNNNGVFDPTLGETGLSGVTVTLDGPATKATVTTTTNAAGIYTFDNLPAGDYVVKAPLSVGGAVIGLNNPAGTYTVTASGAEYPVALGVGQNFLDADFGYVPQVLAPPKLGDFVWLDTDADGVQDAGEPGIAGAKITITNTTGGSFTATTDSNGLYELEVTAGTWTAKVDQTSVADGLVITTVSSYTVVITTEDFLDADFGFAEGIPVTGMTTGWFAVWGTLMFLFGAFLLATTKRIRRLVAA